VQRVAILGSGGAGKSVLAAAVGERTGLPVVHLDVVYWQPGWTKPPRDQFGAKLDAVVAEDRWILDGNFLRDDRADPRFARVDTVIFLDLPRRLCLWRIVKRRVQEARRPRRDLPEGCSESFDLEFTRWVWNYPLKNRPDIVGRMAALSPEVAVHRLRSQRDVDRFLDSI
jgi:adenylate kinase family enzyme